MKLAGYSQRSQVIQGMGDRAGEKERRGTVAQANDRDRETSDGSGKVLMVVG